MEIERETIKQVLKNEISLALKDLTISGLWPEAAEFKGEKDFIPALLNKYGSRLDEMRHELKNGKISLRDVDKIIAEMLETADKNLEQFPAGLKWLNDFVLKKQNEMNRASYILEKIAFKCATSEIEQNPNYERLTEIYNSARADITANSIRLDEKTTASQSEKALEIYQKILEAVEDIRDQIKTIKNGEGISMKEEKIETRPEYTKNTIREPSYYIKRDLQEKGKPYKFISFLANNVNTYLSKEQLGEFMKTMPGTHPAMLIKDIKRNACYRDWPYEIRKRGRYTAVEYGFFAKENAQTNSGADDQKPAAPPNTADKKKNKEIIINMGEYEEWKNLMFPPPYMAKIEKIILDFLASHKPDTHTTIDEVDEFLTTRYKQEEFKENNIPEDEERRHIRIQGVFRVLYRKSKDINKFFFIGMDKTGSGEVDQKEAWIKIIL